MKNIAFKKKYLVSEAIGATSLDESYLISDAETGLGMAAVEEHSTTAQKIAKAFVDKAFLPTRLIMKTTEGTTVLEMFQPASLFRSVFTVRNPDGKILCIFKQKLTLLNPGIVVEDEHGQKLGSIMGGWKLRNFQFKDNNGNAIASIKHLFGGVTKELLTTADDYEVDILGDSSMTLISLAATICIDFMYHES
ncbi:MAG: phospholipid scramblase-related protein [Candidatus Riflebacteria bacterium]|nr:phospholipid scramblase-related protein [Candidatus Riflebacteria bacterium]